jgi:hypothetical protein
MTKDKGARPQQLNTADQDHTEAEYFGIAGIANSQVRVLWNYLATPNSQNGCHGWWCGCGFVACFWNLFVEYAGFPVGASRAQLTRHEASNQGATSTRQLLLVGAQVVTT